MATVNEILNFLFSIAPERMKEDWDTVGLFCGHGERQVHRVLVALDPSMAAISEAAAQGAELLVTHHPLLFAATQNVSDQTEVGRKVLALAENGIAAIGMHTNLDIAAGGVNDCLAAALGLENVQVFHPTGEENGSVYGLGRIGTVPQQSLQQFALYVKRALSLTGLRYADGGKPVHTVAVGGGACMELAEEAAARGCDTFVTGDGKYHQFQQAEALGLNLIDAGHFGTENPVCRYLQRVLRQQFPSLRVEISTAHTDVVRFC